MSKWDVTTTQAAIDLAAQFDVRGIEHFNTYVASPAHRAKTAAVRSNLHKLYFELREGNGKAFTETIELVYPIWQDEIVHTRRALPSLLGEWMGVTERTLGADVLMANIVTNFLQNAIGHSDYMVSTWLRRIEDIIALTKYPENITTSCYVPNVSMDDVKKLHSSSRNIRDMIAGLSLGFNVEELKKVNNCFYSVSRKFTPENLRSINDRHSYKSINSVLGLCYVVTLTKPSFEELVTVLDAGFESDKAFKAFVRNTGTDYSDPDLYAKIIQMRGKITDEETAILSLHKPDMKDLVKILVKF